MIIVFKIPTHAQKLRIRSTGRLLIIRIKFLFLMQSIRIASA